MRIFPPASIITAMIYRVDVSDEAGDKICLFGFSRGAYTARALAGMVHKVRIIAINLSLRSRIVTANT